MRRYSSAPAEALLSPAHPPQHPTAPWPREGKACDVAVVSWGTSLGSVIFCETSTEAGEPNAGGEL